MRRLTEGSLQNQNDDMATPKVRAAPASCRAVTFRNRSGQGAKSLAKDVVKPGSFTKHYVNAGRVTQRQTRQAATQKAFAALLHYHNEANGPVANATRVFNFRARLTDSAVKLQLKHARNDS